MLGDSAQIQQIMMNLITNANEAIGNESGTITVSTGRMYADKLYLNQLSYNHNAVPGDYVFFEISDTGCGMDQATREQLFDPFFTTKFTGRGLGMSAVIGIIQSHHGALALYSEPGQGTAFKVLFPTTDVPIPEPVDISEKPQLQHDYTVLVVDDEDIVRESTTSILDFMGFRSLAAESGEKAVQIVKQQPDSVDMVLLDMTMPGMNGVETFKALRAISSGLPVVLASGYSTADTIALFAEEKPNGFIQKPFIPSDLYGVLVKALEI